MTTISLNQPITIPQSIIEELTRVVIKEQLNEQMLKMTVSLNELISMTGVSKSTLEKVFIPLTEAKAIEYRVGTKRVWLYPEVKSVWIEFLKSIN